MQTIYDQEQMINRHEKPMYRRYRNLGQKQDMLTIRQAVIDCDIVKDRSIAGMQQPTYLRMYVSSIPFNTPPQ